MVTDHILSKVGLEPLYSHYYATTYPQVHAAALRLFGSWKEAIARCGLNYAMVRRYRSWSREQVIKEITLLNARNTNLSSTHIQQEYKALYMAALKRFGNWQKALESSGVPYDAIRQRQQPDADFIREEILKLYRSGISLAYTNMRKNHSFLLSHALRKLGNGSWVQARKVCGINDNYRKLGQLNAKKSRNNRKQYIFSLEELIRPSAGE